MYVCRTLSYKGADFDIVGASLEERMTVKRHNIDKLSAFELLLFFYHVLFQLFFALRLYRLCPFFFYHINVFFCSMSDFL